MTQEQYDQQKRECWEEFIGNDGFPTETMRQCFNCAFDRAYTLGKEDISAKPTESKSIQLSDVKAKIDARMDSHTDEEVYECLKKYGAVEDVDTVIQGWVARDKEGDIFLYKHQPKRIYDGEYSRWEEDIICTHSLPCELFPNLTWDSDPLPVEIIIKRKKNG